MMENLDRLIKELSSIYDENSLNTFVSVYFDGKDKKFIERRKKAITSVLKGKELENFEKTMEEIEDFLDENTIIFASHKYGYIKVIRHKVIKNLLIVDSSPYIRPLVEDEGVAYTLLLINTNHAKIISISHGKIEDEKNLSAHIINKHKKGGSSQARFQRIRKEEIHAFFVKVKEALNKFVEDKIVVAGPGIAKQEFIDILPKRLKEKIVAVIDADMHDENGIISEAMEIVEKEDEELKKELMTHIKNEILKEGLATYGIDEVMEAVRNGQVEVLMVEKDYRLLGWLCEHCQALGKGTIKECPYCHRKTTEVDVIEEIIEFAERTDAIVKFIEGEEIKNLGHVVALLRYK